MAGLSPRDEVLVQPHTKDGKDCWGDRLGGRLKEPFQVASQQDNLQTIKLVARNGEPVGVPLGIVKKVSISRRPR